MGDELEPKPSKKSLGTASFATNSYALRLPNFLEVAAKHLLTMWSVLLLYEYGFKVDQALLCN